MKKISQSLLLILAVIGLNSCIEETPPINKTVESFEELHIDDSFDFSTTKEVAVNILAADGVHSVFYIYDGNPDVEGKLLKKGLTGSDFAFHGSITIPSTVESIFIERQSFDGTRQVSQQELSGNDFHATFNNSNKSASTVNNLLTNGDFETSGYSFNYENNLQSNVSSTTLDVWTLKSWQNNKPNSVLHTIGSNNVIKMTDNKTNKETFAYYYIAATENTQYTLEADADLVDDDDDLEPYVQLAFLSANGQEIDSYDVEVVGSGWNTYTITETSPSNTVYIKVIIATSNSGKGEVHFDNIELTGAPTVADADSDGVPDSMDEYPNDPDRALNSYYPNAVDFASLGFEDLWPAKGDYDFNDLVIDFQYQIVTNASNNIIDIIGKFKIKAIGATFSNGFGVSLDVSPSLVASATGMQHMGSIISQAANGLEAGHASKSVFIVYDNVTAFANNGMVNTTAGTSAIDFPLTTVTVTLATPQASIGTEPFNPFIFINQNRGREVHLTDKMPTDLVDNTFFGQEDDNTNGSTNNYKTINNYPWAIETPSSFAYPIEKVDIVNAHTKFGPWAEAAGSNYSNWYENQPGYRNGQNIY